METVKIAVIVLLSISSVYLVLITFFTLKYRPGRKRNSQVFKLKPPVSFPSVSILKPVKGLDDELEVNLESFYRLDYPVYEILFAVDYWNDPAYEVIMRVADKYPHIKTIILATGQPEAQNPKVHKLARMESESRGRLLWVTDANVRVESNTLRRLVEEYHSTGASLIFSPIQGTSSRTFASLIENAGLNFFTSGNVMVLWKLFRQPVVVGKSILIDSLVLKTFGGFSYFKDYLAEDYLIGKSFRQKGYKVSTNFTWVTNTNRQATTRSLVKRLARWARLRYQLNRPVYLLEIILNPLVLSLAGAAAFRPLFWQPILIILTLKILLEYLNFMAVNEQDRKRLLNYLLFPAVVVAKDIIFLAVYLVPFLSSTIDWRGRKIRIGKNSLICPTPAHEEYSYQEHDTTQNPGTLFGP